MATRKRSREPGRPDLRLSTPITAVDVDGTELGLYLHDRGVLWLAKGTGAECWTGVSDLVRIGMFVLAALGRGLAEGEELDLHARVGEAILNFGNFVTDIHVALDHPEHPRLEGFVGVEEMARAVAAGIQMLMPSYSLLELGVDDIKRSALRTRHVAAYRELTFNHG